jgi:hypothetical protein
MYVCISVVALVALETLGSNGSMRITQGQAEKAQKKKAPLHDQHATNRQKKSG